MVTVVSMVVVASVPVVPNPEHAPDTTNDAADHAACYTADNRSNGSGGTCANRGASFTATYNSLRLCGERHRENNKDACAD